MKRWLYLVLRVSRVILLIFLAFYGILALFIGVFFWGMVGSGRRNNDY